MREGKHHSATIVALPQLHRAESAAHDNVTHHPKPSGRQHKSTQHGHSSSASHKKSHPATHAQTNDDHVTDHKPANAAEHIPAPGANHPHRDDANGDQHEESDDAGPGRRRRQVPTKRLNLVLTEKLYNEVADLAERQGKSVTEVLRIGLGLAHLAATQHSIGGRLAIVDQDGTMHYVLIPH
jgi:hypothetical protein